MRCIYVLVRILALYFTLTNIASSRLHLFHINIYSVRGAGAAGRVDIPGHRAHWTNY